ncbi:MAG: ferritin [Pirellulales bacterium]
MLSPQVQDALNNQLNTEFTSAYNYLAMSAYCELANFLGCAAWLKAQSQEEYTHGMKLYHFLLARNCKVVLKPIPAAPSDFGSVVDVFEQALAQERDVTGRIESLYEMAFNQKAFAELVELQWFITEQVEEERTARDIAAKFRMVKNDPAALLDLDRELGNRTPGKPAPSAVGGAA